MSGCGQHQVIDRSGRMLKSGPYIFLIEVREIREDIGNAFTPSERCTDIADPHAPAASMWSTPTNVGIENDAAADFRGRPGIRHGRSHFGSP